MMYVKIIYKPNIESCDFELHEYTNVQNILSTVDGMSIEHSKNQYDVYLHKQIHSVEIRQEKPEN